jgi:membrane-associated protease RseP (regulator of RpoE activity)
VTDLPPGSRWPATPAHPALPTPGADDAFSTPFVVEPRARQRPFPWRHLLLLLATLVTTTMTGALHHEGFLLDFVTRPLVFTSWPQIVLAGLLFYALPVMAILGAHEAGHYLACRYYRVDATLPYFLPLPLGLTGTLGAFIRIRSPIRTKQALFDIAVAGPIAGFLVLVPLLLAGLYASRVAKLPADFVGFELGEPLLFQAAARLIKGPVPDGSSLNLHPTAMAAWFGMLMTAINLFPFGQLDGGHVSYAALGRRSSLVTLLCLAVAVGLAFTAQSWILWAVLLAVMLLVLGPHHPPVLDEHVPLSRGRLLIALAVVAIFLACFTPVPIEPYELIRPR